MQELMIFEGHEVEILELNGHILFNPHQVGKCLDLAYGTVKDHMSKMNNKQVIKLTNSDVGLTSFRKLNNAGENFLTESGVYKLVFKSRKPNAEAFTDWVTSEVLPQIRQTGGYIPVSDQDDDLTIMAKAHQILERTIANKELLIEQMKPKADTYDMIMAADGTFSMNQVAKQVGMGEYKLFAYLREKKVLFMQGDDNVPYERFRKNGCFKVVDTKSPDGKSHSTTRVTQRGLDYICKLIRKDKEVA